MSPNIEDINKYVLNDIFLLLTQLQKQVMRFNVQKKILCLLDRASSW